jgi:hypothetical protein
MACLAIDHSVSMVAHDYSSSISERRSMCEDERVKFVSDWKVAIVDSSLGYWI